jgi:ribosome biogenesis GTPase
VILLNKLDSCPDESPYKSQAIAIAGDVPIVSISAKTGVNVDRLSEWIKSGRTVGLIGSSGVGKSTLINRLIASSDIPTAQTRSSDERGRHTTTRREMYLVPGGGILMDTPGMREMQLWDTEKGMSDTFPEIDSLAQSCRFKDCAHNAEPGCAVKEGLTSGAVTPQRLASWQKLQGELKDRREIAMKKNWNNPPKAGGR